MAERKRKHVGRKALTYRGKMKAAVDLGHRGGLKGGAARNKVLTKREKVVIARKGQAALRKKQGKAKAG